jgi:hypothetical protein
VSKSTDPDPIAVWESGDAVYVARLPRGPITVLAGTAGAIWRAATAGPIEGAAERVAAATGMETEAIRESVDAFIDRLVAQRLIQRSH